MARKEIQALIEELRSWLPNYDHTADSYPTTLYRILASLPGGEELEDMGYEPMGGIGWHEADQLGRILETIQNKHDVEDLVAGLVREEEEEDLGEARRRPQMRERHQDYEVVDRGRVIAHIQAPSIQSARLDLERGKRSGWYPKSATARDPRRAVARRRTRL